MEKGELELSNTFNTPLSPRPNNHFGYPGKIRELMIIPYSSLNRNAKSIKTGTA